MSDEDGSLLKDLVKLIPGYGAYVEQESRRNDDRLTREFLATRLNDCKRALDQCGRGAVERGDLELPTKLEGARDQIDLAQRRLAAAVEGYSGWFSDRNVDARVLGDVAESDANLVSLVDQIDAMCRGLDCTKSDASQSTLGEIHEALAMLHQRIDRRSEILKGMH